MTSWPFYVEYTDHYWSLWKKESRPGSYVLHDTGKTPIPEKYLGYPRRKEMIHEWGEWENVPEETPSES